MRSKNVKLDAKHKSRYWHTHNGTATGGRGTGCGCAGRTCGTGTATATAGRGSGTCTTWCDRITGRPRGCSCCGTPTGRCALSCCGCGNPTGTALGCSALDTAAAAAAIAGLPANAAEVKSSCLTSFLIGGCDDAAGTGARGGGGGPPPPCCSFPAIYLIHPTPTKLPDQHAAPSPSLPPRHTYRNSTPPHPHPQFAAAAEARGEIAAAVARSGGKASPRGRSWRGWIRRELPTRACLRRRGREWRISERRGVSELGISGFSLLLQLLSSSPSSLSFFLHPLSFSSHSSLSKSNSYSTAGSWGRAGIGRRSAAGPHPAARIHRR